MFGIPFGTAPYGGIPYVPPALPTGMNIMPVRQNGIFVRFAAAVTQSTPLDITDALNPDNYILSASGVSNPPIRTGAAGLDTSMICSPAA